MNSLTVSPLPNVPPDVSAKMRRVRSEGTGPEKSFYQALRRIGFSFETHRRDLPGKPDIVFPLARLAVFLDGDLWHGHQWKLRGFGSLDDQFVGISNSNYWQSKLSNNLERDFSNTASLLDAGWRVLRFWSSDFEHRLDQCVQTTIAAVRRLTNPEVAAFSELPSRTVTELFAGIGLVRLALEQHNWRVVFANDNDIQKYEMYQDNFGGDHIDQRDIRLISGQEVPTSALFTASFPCNDLSIAGARSGLGGHHSSMFWELIRILNEMESRRPPIVFLENVFGFLTSHSGKDFETALHALSELGYSCDAFVLDASRFVPQSRVRLFVIAKQEPPSPDSTVHLLPSTLRPRQLVTFIKEHPEIRWNLRRLPQPPDRKPKLIDILEKLPEDAPHWWSNARSEYFMNQLSERHLTVATSMISGTKYRYATAFRRIRHKRSMAELRSDGIAGCLRTPRGGSGRQILFKAGKGKFSVRLLTARECARLQGVPDEKYKITAPLNKALFGFGDAVCVPVIEWIAQHYLTPLASELIRGETLCPHA